MLVSACLQGVLTYTPRLVSVNYQGMFSFLVLKAVRLILRVGAYLGSLRVASALCSNSYGLYLRDSVAY